jgi:glutamine synthetase
MEYQRNVAASIDEVEDVLSSVSLTGQRSLLEALAQAVEKFIVKLEALDATRSKAPESDDHLKVATYFRDKIIPAMQELRAAGDELEVLVDNRIWPMPKYRDLLHLN